MWFSPFYSQSFFPLLFGFKSYSLFLNISAFLGVTSPVDILMYTLPHPLLLFCVFLEYIFFFFLYLERKKIEKL